VTNSAALTLKHLLAPGDECVKLVGIVGQLEGIEVQRQCLKLFVAVTVSNIGG
jgi:hypothetical protein